LQEKHIFFSLILTKAELLALNPNDVDLEKRTISITKSYQRFGKKDVITPPKTPKSKRVITIPEFLAADIKDYMDSLLYIYDMISGMSRADVKNVLLIMHIDSVILEVVPHT